MSWKTLEMIGRSKDLTPKRNEHVEQDEPRYTQKERVCSSIHLDNS